MDRFWQKVAIKKDNECWEWQGPRDRDGYGVFNNDNKVYKAHRYSYSLTNKLLHGKHICHTCDNPCCVNPNHLWQGTSQQNHKDKLDKKRHHHKVSYEIAKQIYVTKGTYKEIAKKYNLSVYTVWRIKNNNYKGFNLALMLSRC